MIKVYAPSWRADVYAKHIIGVYPRSQARGLYQAYDKSIRRELASGCIPKRIIILYTRSQARGLYQAYDKSIRRELASVCIRQAHNRSIPPLASSRIIPGV